MNQKTLETTKYAVISEDGYIGAVHAHSPQAARDQARYRFNLWGKEFFVTEKLIQMTIDHMMK